jgi:hypothetical protein
MLIDSSTNTTEDSVKRGKLIALAFLVALSIFIQNLTKQAEPTLITTVVTALVYFVLSVVGITWAFNFEVKIRSIPYLLHSSLFVMSEYLFVQLFFAQKFSRIYEGLLLFILVLLIFAGTYVSFLMANVFNVNLYKNIPLVHVGRTTSYIVSTLTVFFLIFSFLALQISIYILLPLVFIIAIFLTFIHLKNLGFESMLLKRKTFLVSFLVLLLFLSSFLSGVMHELSALSPTVGYFVGVGVAHMKRNKMDDKWEMFLYIVALIAIVFVNLFLNVL